MKQLMIRKRGKKEVMKQLRQVGWSYVNEIRDERSPCDVEASHKGKRILVSVTPEAYPYRPRSLDREEVDRLKEEAIHNNLGIYQAKVFMDISLRHVYEISWVAIAP
jgi:hypothetical protein